MGVGPAPDEPADPPQPASKAARTTENVAVTGLYNVLILNSAGC